ncbi:MAG: hypothetical protein IJB97_04700 [Clostridia bacterium]|nr:hypothetical protein [Clostridia bacterium]
MLSLVDELELSSNAYRTKNYIVTQRIMFRQTEADGAMIMNVEVFYKRNKERDTIYEKVFSNRIKLDGKRLHTTMYTRSYVE